MRAMPLQSRPACSALIRLEAARLRASRRRGPVIAAGSTGSIPATAELLAGDRRSANGAVVLPGLDQRLDAAVWAALGGAAPEPARWRRDPSAIRHWRG